MPHLGRANGASLVPDISSGVNALAQGIIFKQKQGRVDQQRAEASGLIEKLGAPGVTSDQEQKTLLRLSQLLTPQQLQSVQGILQRGDLEELAAFQKQADDAFRFAASLEGLSHPEQIKAINTEFQRLAVIKDTIPPEQQTEIQQRMDELVKLGQKSKGELDIAIFRQKVLSTDTKSAAKFAQARRQGQLDRVARDSFQVSQLPVEQQAPFLIDKIFKGEQTGQNVDHLRQLQRLEPPRRKILAEANINRARKLEDIVKPPKLIKGKAGDSFFDPEGNLKFTVAGEAGGGVDFAKPAVRDFTPESVAIANKTGGSISDLVLRPEALARLGGGDTFKIGREVKIRIGDKEFFVTPVTQRDKTGKVVTVGNLTPIVGPDKDKKIDFISPLGETGQQQTQRGIGEAGGKAQATADVAINTVGEIAKQKARGAGKEARLQKFINGGIQVSGTAANLNRSLELLKSTPTGGIDALKLKFKQFFGVEGGDEAELAQNFMKNVLKQLKPTFGAQFTEKEGRLLIDIEAGFGKSTEGNIRLLEQALKIINKAARRGIKAAEEAGDFTAADAIRENLDFSLNPEPKPNKVGRFEIEVE